MTVSTKTKTVPNFSSLANLLINNYFMRFTWLGKPGGGPQKNWPGGPAYFGDSVRALRAGLGFPALVAL